MAPLVLHILIWTKIKINLCLLHCTTLITISQLLLSILNTISLMDLLVIQTSPLQQVYTYCIVTDCVICTIVFYTVPTAVRDIKVAMSTPESIYITWDHPEYPNSQLLNYIFYYNATMLQSRGEISTDGFEDVTLAIVTSHNLTGLSSFINYTILITVTGRDVDDAAPFEVEILHRTNASGKLCFYPLI